MFTPKEINAATWFARGVIAGAVTLDNGVCYDSWHSLSDLGLSLDVHIDNNEDPDGSGDFPFTAFLYREVPDPKMPANKGFVMTDTDQELKLF